MIFKIQLKYLLGVVITFPVLPLMYLQGRKIRSKVPQLSEARHPQGESGDFKEHITLITIGESTVAGVGVATHEEGFTGTLARELNRLSKKKVLWRVYAKSGYTVQRVHERLLPKIEERKVDLIVIALGGNDTFKLHSPMRWKNDINSLIHGARKKFGETPIFFTNMPPIRSFPAFTPLIKFVMGNLVDLLGATLNEIAAENSNVYFDDSKITFKGWIDRWQLDNQPQDFFSDGVHPSKLTYQTWATSMAEFIHKNSKEKF